VWYCHVLGILISYRTTTEKGSFLYSLTKNYYLDFYTLLYCTALQISGVSHFLLYRQRVLPYSYPTTGLSDLHYLLPHKANREIVPLRNRAFVFNHGLHGFLRIITDGRGKGFHATPFCIPW